MKNEYQKGKMKTLFQMYIICIQKVCLLLYCFMI